MNSRLSQFFTIAGSGYELGVKAIFLAVFLAIAQLFIVTFAQVKGPSMAPILADGQWLVVEKASRFWHTPERGEIVVVRFPADPDQVSLVKRVIGKPGEQIDVSHGQVRVNGQLLNEVYLTISAETVGESHIQLGPDEYFLLGDNRAVSNDSRSFGPVEKRFIAGYARLIIWPPREAKLIEPVYY